MLECTWSLDSAEMRIDGCILDTILSQSFTADQACTADAVEIFVYDSHSSYIREYRTLTHKLQRSNQRVHQALLYGMHMTMKMWPLALFVFVLAAVPPPYCVL